MSRSPEKALIVDSCFLKLIIFNCLPLKFDPYSPSHIVCDPWQRRPYKKELQKMMMSGCEVKLCCFSLVLHSVTVTWTELLFEINANL